MTVSEDDIKKAIHRIARRKGPTSEKLRMAMKVGYIAANREQNELKIRDIMDQIQECRSKQCDAFSNPFAWR